MEMEIKLTLPDDVDAFDIFCYRREGSIVGVGTIRIDKDTKTLEIYRGDEGIYKVRRG